MCINFIKEEITLAFNGVRLEDGIGLWEAQVIDDYGAKDEQSYARLKDEKNDWKSISGSDLFICDSSLSFMDAKGMRFHIPAFILGEIEGNTNTSPIYHLTQVVTNKPELFGEFNAKQKAAVAKYLKWCVRQEHYRIDKYHITRALNEFWCKS
jgi:hypothetical protein